MVFLALLIIPIVFGEYLIDLTPTQNLVLQVLSWIIYSMFFSEFVLKVLVAQDKRSFFGTNKLYVATSLIIIISPTLEPISELFAVTPALRAFKAVSILKLSNLTKLAAASSKVKLFWRRINLKTYTLVSMTILLAFSASFFAPELILSLNDQTLFLQFIAVIGTIYAIITGFMIANVWNKYLALINLMSKSTTSLKTVYVLSLQLNTPILVKNLEKEIQNYITSAIEVYWDETKPLKYLDSKSEAVLKTLYDYIPKELKDLEPFTSIVEELRTFSGTKAGIQALILSRVPKVLWTLLIMLSFTIVLSMYLLPYGSQILATFSITLISIAVALIGLIIYDMDDPFKFGFWAVSPKEYFNFQEFLAA